MLLFVSLLVYLLFPYLFIIFFYPKGHRIRVYVIPSPIYINFIHFISRYTKMVEPNEEIIDCRMPGGGSMYYLRRVDRKGT